MHHKFYSQEILRPGLRLVGLWPEKMLDTSHLSSFRDIPTPKFEITRLTWYICFETTFTTTLNARKPTSILACELRRRISLKFWTEQNQKPNLILLMSRVAWERNKYRHSNLFKWVLLYICIFTLVKMWFSYDNWLLSNVNGNPFLYLLSKTN